MEAVERLWEPPEIHGEHLLTVSVMGLGVNIIGLIFFHDVAHAHGGHGHGGVVHPCDRTGQGPWHGKGGRVPRRAPLGVGCKRGHAPQLGG